MNLDDFGGLETIRFTNLNVILFLQISEPIYPKLMRMFYNNLYVNENDKSFTYILGYHIFIIDDILYDILGIAKKRMLFSSKIINKTSSPLGSLNMMLLSLFLEIPTYLLSLRAISIFYHLIYNYFIIF